ncbi:hypothetical protein DdX_03791 [Ditylenchus destructor]|uniref:Uncharacterized protein n=1 Tax=Ditylenchus destructor TaxID=166010 RepID=A0AAD4NAZ6_9BILA|nr:hypothetical protein DdX_03791 [Ditylenchus destructor]
MSSCQTFTVLLVLALVCLLISESEAQINPYYNYLNPYYRGYNWPYSYYGVGKRSAGFGGSLQDGPPQFA